jgi:glycosyltransferase involved in cell wall biosynthesis
MQRVCGQTTLYARNGDAGDLAEQIGALADDPERRARLGEAARQRLQDGGLSWPDQVPTLFAAIDRAIALKRKPRAEQPDPQPEHGRA